MNEYEVPYQNDEIGKYEWRKDMGAVRCLEIPKLKSKPYIKLKFQVNPI